MCVFVCVHLGVNIWTTMRDLILIAHGLKFALKTVYVLMERMCVGAADSMFCI